MMFDNELGYWPPGTLWVSAFVDVAKSFSSLAARRRAEALGYGYQAHLRGLPDYFFKHHQAAGAGQPPEGGTTPHHLYCDTPLYHAGRCASSAPVCALAGVYDTPLHDALRWRSLPF
jgi:hypothetical protein